METPKRSCGCNLSSHCTKNHQRKVWLTIKEMGIFCVGKNAKPSQKFHNTQKQVGSDRFCYFQPPSLTSNCSLSFEARDLKVWIQTASSLAKKHHLDFSYFTREMRNDGFTKLKNQIRQVR